MAIGPPSRLSPVVSFGRLVGLSFAMIAPASSVFLTYGTAYRQAGTGVFLGFVLAAGLNLAIMFCYAEVGSVYPEAGGDYALAARALGRAAGSVYSVLFAIKGMAIPALLALSTADYLHQAAPVFPTVPTAGAIFLLTVALAALDLRTSSLAATLMVGIELAVFIGFMAVGLLHLRQPPEVLLHPVMAVHQTLFPVARSRWLMTVAAALYGLNGPQAYLYYSEETAAAPRRLGRAILGTALVTILIELSAVVVGTLALPSLASPGGPLPLARMMEAGLGVGWVRPVLLLGITVALFDTGLATTMSYARIFYAIARDGQWPRAVNALCARVSRRGIPIGALMCLGIVNLGVLAAFDVHFLVTLGGTVLIVLYLGIAAAALVTRISVGPGPYAMPGWPLAPLLALVGLSGVLAQLTPPQLAVTGGLVLMGIAWSFFVSAGAG